MYWLFPACASQWLTCLKVPKNARATLELALDRLQPFEAVPSCILPTWASDAAQGAPPELFQCH
eukprot:3546310-Alexandrium_andersonii.AAC.1